MNHVKCWLCGRWIKEEYTYKMKFSGSEESICPECFQKQIDADRTNEEMWKLNQEVLKNEERNKKPYQS